MIFRPELAAKVLDGTKTVTRRILRSNKVPYRRDRVYAVQPGRGKRHIGHVVVDDVTEGLLGDVDDREARAEGFESAAAFADYWRTLHGGNFDPAQRVTVIRFARTYFDAFCCAEMGTKGEER